MARSGSFMLLIVASILVGPVYFDSSMMLDSPASDIVVVKPVKSTPWIIFAIFILQKFFLTIETLYRFIYYNKKKTYTSILQITLMTPASVSALLETLYTSNHPTYEQNETDAHEHNKEM
jgi:multisubunit Na+/H+ antiporter MnhG subunit